MSEIKTLTINGKTYHVEGFPPYLSEGGTWMVYDTAADAYADTGIAAQLKPEFANSVEECTDTSKLYVLPDGYIYAYTLSKQSGAVNWLPLAIDSDGSVYNGTGYLEGYRVRSTGAVVAADGAYCTGYIPVKLGDVIHLSNIILPKSGAANQSYFSIYAADASFTKIEAIAMANLGAGSYETDSNNNVVTFYTANLVGADGNNDCRTDALAYIRITAQEITKESVITINEQEQEQEGEADYSWANTGHAFVPADYENRIVALEKALKGDLPVYGIVDDENNIILSGVLASGEYVLRYQNDDGTTTDIGTFTVE